MKIKLLQAQTNGSEGFGPDRVRYAAGDVCEVGVEFTPHSIPEYKAQRWLETGAAEATDEPLTHPIAERKALPIRPMSDILQTLGFRIHHRADDSALEGEIVSD